MITCQLIEHRSLKQVNINTLKVRTFGIGQRTLTLILFLLLSLLSKTTLGYAEVALTPAKNLRVIDSEVTNERYPMDSNLNTELNLTRSLKGIDAPIERCKGVFVDNFGAKGDGKTDDGGAIISAANYAQDRKEWLVFSGGKSYKVSNYIILKNGIRGAIVCGTNPATIIADNAKAFLIPERSDNILIQGFTIDAMHSDGNVIYGKSVRNITVRDNRIINHGAGSAIIFIAMPGVGSQEGIAIENNKIISKLPSLGAPYSESIKIKSKAAYSAPDYWQENHTDMPTPDRSLKVKITNNDIKGGYYGIGLTELSYSLIAENKIQDNIRNISMQQGCSYNIVQDNILLNSVSASIHLAYNPNNNYIYSNTIRSEKASGWGAIQLQLGGRNNRIEKNHIESLSKDSNNSWYYSIYAAVHAEGNQIIGNSLYGPVEKAYIGLESGWGKYNDPVHVTNPYPGKWSIQSSANNIIYDNKIFISCSKPAIYLGQIKDQYGDHFLVDNQVVNNSIVGDNNTQFLKLIESSDNGIKGLIIEN